MDIVKHIAVFDPNLIRGKVAVIGLGALGSAVALQLAKLGLSLTLFDDDSVAGHNIANQVLYGPTDVGLPKVEAAAKVLFELTGSRSITNCEKVTARHQVRGFHSLFVCVDSMAQRSALCDLTFCAGITLLVEGRMGARNGAAYCFYPDDRRQLGLYRRELYQDEDVVEDRAVCGTTQSVVSTASMVASHMVWLFISNVMTPKSATHEVVFSTSPPSLTTRRFKNSTED